MSKRRKIEHMDSDPPPTSCPPTDDDTSVEPEPNFWQAVLIAARQMENMIDEALPVFRDDGFPDVIEKLEACIQKLKTTRADPWDGFTSQPAPAGYEWISMVNPNGQTIYQLRCVNS